MTIIISTGRVTFHDFTCLVFQGDSSGPLVYLESNGNCTQFGMYCLLLQQVASVITLLVSPGSPATSAGLQKKLALLFVNKRNNSDTKSEAQKFSLVFLNP